MNKAFLYSPIPTHYNLTQQMIDLYNLTYDPDITMKQVELIMKGSLDEDTLPRPAFHLYDPVYNRAPFGVHTAKKWALDSNAQTPFYLRIAAIKKIFTGTFLYHGDYSWPASVNYFVKDDLDKAYYGLGHILHLIEDMTVPAHTRNDHHIMGDPLEQWARDNTIPDDYSWAEKLYNQGYFPKYLYSLEQTFDDLARYSNKYFFSKDTILHPDYSWPKIVKIKREDYSYWVQRTYAWGRDEDGRLFRLAFVDHYKTNWDKAFHGIEQQNYILSLDRDDHKLNSDYWQRLAPKAIIYGAGVIRLFVKEVEWQKLAQKELESSFFQKAQLFVKGLLGIGGDEEKKEEVVILSESWPQPKPSRFPDVGPALELIGDESDKTDLPSEALPKKDKSDKSDKTDKKKIKEEPIQEKSEESQEIEKEKEEEGGTIIKGPKTGGGNGGISFAQAEEIHQQRVGGGEEQQQEQGGQQEEEPESQPEPEPETPPHLVINEIQVKDSEFVELYNLTDTAISLASYSFCYYSKSRDWNDPYRNKLFPENASISAGGYYLIGLKGYPEEEGNPDADWQVYESNQLSNSAGSIAIFPWDPSERNASEAQAGVVDVAAWGDVENIVESIPFQETIGQDKSIQRKDSGQDTDDNNADFELQKIPSPTNSNSEERIPGTTIADDTVISEDTTWTIAGSPYYIESNTEQWPVVETGVTLFIEPGVVIMPLNANYTFLEIRGTLKAEGTESEKIVFTSKNDTEYGEIGSASAGDWKNIIFTDTSTDSIFDYVLFQYGGHPNGEMIKVERSSIEIKNSTIENSQTNGIYLKDSNLEIKDSVISDTQTGIVIEGGSPEIENCQIKNNSQYGIEIRNGAEPEIKDNSFSDNLLAAVYLQSAYPKFSNNNVSNNGLNGVFVDSQTVINQDETWEADLVYILESNKGQFTTIASGSSLTLEPGVVIKPQSQFYTALLIEGTLIAEAASDSEIVFTSLKDDSGGGDTNNDGDVTNPADGDWNDIRFMGSGQGSILDHVFIYYGSANPIIIEAGADVDIKDTVDYAP